MADPFNYLAGFNPAQSILQSVQGGIASAGQGDSAAVAREKMQMQREEFGLSQQLKREQMAQSKGIAEAQISATNAARDLAQKKFDVEQENQRMVLSAVRSAYENPGDPKAFRESVATLTALAPDRMKALEDQNTAMRMRVGDEALDAFSKTVFNAVQLVKSGKKEDAVSRLADLSSALAAKQSETKNPALGNLAEILATTASQIEDPNVSNEEIIGALNFSGMADPNYRKLMKDFAEIQKTEADTAKAGSVEVDKKEVNSLVESINESKSRINEADSLISRVKQTAATRQGGLKGAMALAFNELFSPKASEQKLLANAISFYTNKDWLARVALMKGALSNQEGKRMDAGIPDAKTGKVNELLEYLEASKKILKAENVRKQIEIKWLKSGNTFADPLSDKDVEVKINGEKFVIPAGASLTEAVDAAFSKMRGSEPKEQPDGALPKNPSAKKQKPVVKILSVEPSR